jgi:hypothetical protein
MLFSPSFQYSSMIVLGNAIPLQYFNLDLFIVMPRIKVYLMQGYPHKVENLTLEYFQLLKTLLA